MAQTKSTLKKKKVNYLCVPGNCFKSKCHLKTIHSFPLISIKKMSILGTYGCLLQRGDLGSLLCVISYVESTFHFIGPTSPDLRHSPNVEREALLLLLMVQSWSWISFCIIKSRLHCQGWEQGNQSGWVPPSCAFCISVQSSRPMPFGHQWFIDCIAQMFFSKTGSNKTLLKRKATGVALLIRQ